jgi:hypothetical protein
MTERAHAKVWLRILIIVLVTAGVLWVANMFRLRFAILAELEPVALANCTMKRFGSADDGGYLMCDNLPGAIDAAYSYGVGSNDDWACDVSRRYGVPVHQYDCFNPARPTCSGGTFVFHNECVADQARTDTDGRRFDTLMNHIARNGDTRRQLFVKIDIEGAEWDSLIAAPDELLASIPQLAMELHGYDGSKILRVLRRLKQYFYVVNLNYNNWSCTRRAWPLKAWAYQVLLVNKRHGVLNPAAPVPAPSSDLNALDAPHLPPCR